MITPILVVASKQAAKCRRLAEFCKDLDGTEVLLVPGDEGQNLPYPHCNTASFHLACQKMKGKAFLWMEPDSIPTKKGWLKSINEAWEKCGKEVLISSDSNPPHDAVGGIGVYGPNSHWLFPKSISFGAWDGWMIKHIDPLIGRTPLIQHMYGFYDGSDVVRRFSHPQDASVLRKEAVLFHADPNQTLIPDQIQAPKVQTTFRHTNCRGDIIAALASVKQLGGGRMVLMNHPKAHDLNFRAMKGAMFESLYRLLKRQSYVSDVVYDESPQIVDYDFTNFRNLYRSNECLANIQAKWIGIEKLDTSPWLEADPSPETKGKIVICRSLRYQNQAFPWLQVFSRFGGRIVFVGMEEEYQAMRKNVGKKFEFRPTKDLLEAAELIQGSDMVISNQTSLFWLAIGLGKKVIQETNLKNPDSIVPRHNAQYVRGGSIKW